MNKKTKSKNTIEDNMGFLVRPDGIKSNQILSCREYLYYKRVILVDFLISSPMQLIPMIMCLDSFNDNPITIVFFSPGGCVDSGFAICDVLERLKSTLITVGVSIQSMAVPLFMCGDKRYLLPHTRVMLHLPWGETRGDAIEFNIANREMQNIKNRMVDFLIKRGMKGTKRSILREIDRDNWLTPSEAIEKGIAHEIIDGEKFQKLLK